jgi:carbon-monoxide dehydrogenase large subunit
VIAPDVGGGFGSKIYIYPEEITCLWASMKTGRSVKWTSDRSEAFMTDAHGRDHVTTAKMGFDATARSWASTSTPSPISAPMCRSSPRHADLSLWHALVGHLRHPRDLRHGEGGHTNTVPVDAYRGAGRPEATYMIERMMETAAREMGMDPAELRRKNFIKEFPYQTQVICTMTAATITRFWTRRRHAMSTLRRRKAEAAARGKLRGIGYSTYIEACGIAPSAAVGSLGAGVGLWESARCG